jgi:hypothetical protein
VLACFGSGQPPFSGLAFINSVATLGGFVGPSMMGWLKERSGSCIVGLSAVAAIMLAATAASMSLKLIRHSLFSFERGRANVRRMTAAPRCAEWTESLISTNTRQDVESGALGLLHTVSCFLRSLM